jgi:PEP-CTERM motif
VADRPGTTRSVRFFLTSPAHRERRFFLPPSFFFGVSSTRWCGFKLLPAVAALSLIAGLACGNRACANDVFVGAPPGPQFTITINFGSGDITETGIGGNFQNSKLDGVPTPWLYCTDLMFNVVTNTDYPHTLVTNTGFQNGAFVNNADQVAYLVLTYANAALTNKNLESNLQAAIWSVVYGSEIKSISYDSGFGSASGTATLVSDAQAHAVTGDIAKIAWLSPHVVPGDGPFQGLVTDGSVPEPSSVVMAGLGFLGLLLYLRRRNIA